jgi:L-alanine-DL-glutamate epimerase-like enolase superfamily enzyme
MKITVNSFTVQKRFALTISRGTTAQTTNLWVRVNQEGVEGWGEASPFSIAKEGRLDSQGLMAQFQQLIPHLSQFAVWERQEIEEVLAQQQAHSALRAAIDTALHDWTGKQGNLPLWKLWGLNPERIVPTSVTIGISRPEKAVARLKAWQEQLFTRTFKIKLGSRDGIERDRAMFTALYQAAPTATFSVDANGGWSLDDAIEMSQWLGGYGVKYIEQPLAVGEEDKLPTLKRQSPLPIFVDESCFTSADIPNLVGKVDGINIKLMKAGGLTETLRMIYIAKAWGLKVMFGCYSDSTLANTAMAQLSPLADYLDLDSHLNLTNDPFIGATYRQGRLLPNELPGLGISRQL